MLSELMYFLGRVKITYSKKPFLDTNTFLCFYVQNNSNLIINSHIIYNIHTNPHRNTQSTKNDFKISFFLFHVFKLRLQDLWTNPYDSRQIEPFLDFFLRNQIDKSNLLKTVSQINCITNRIDDSNLLKTIQIFKYKSSGFVCQ
jgi:hypothetical protein